MEWISVNNRLPEYEEVVFLYLPDWANKIQKGFRLKTTKLGEHWNTEIKPDMPNNVTHWMPLPEPPK